MEDDRQAVERELRSFGVEYHRKKAVLAEQDVALREQRDKAVLDAFAAGMTTREIAAVFGGISHQRVAQIVQQR